MDPDQNYMVATQYDFQNYLSFSRPFMIAILIRGQLKNLAQIIIFDVITLYMRGYSFMLLLMAADSSKVLKKSIGESNGLDPDQGRRRSLSGAKLFAKAISR